MRSRRAATVLVCGACLLAACSEDADSAAPAPTVAAASPSAAASPLPGSPDDGYPAALGRGACYRSIHDAAATPAADVSCTAADAAFRLVTIVPGGDACSPELAYVSEEQRADVQDTIAPLLCLQPVTH